VRVTDGDRPARLAREGTEEQNGNAGTGLFNILNILKVQLI